jgi:DNA-binding beta-propeller fold protein YncE
LRGVNTNNGRTFIALCLAAGLLVINAGCFKIAVPEKEPTPVLLWPEPPEIPRISFVNAISRPEEMGIESGVFRNFFRYLAGKADTPLVNPHGVTADPEGRLYVVDHFLRKIHVYDPGGKRYSAFPGKEAALVSPIGIAVDDKRGRIYVSDSAGGVVRIFAREGWKPAGEIRGGEMGRPTGVAIHAANDELLVLDTLHSGILRFSLADHRLKGIIGREGNAEGTFHSPTHIAVSRAGNILVTDSLNYRVQIFTPGGRFLRGFGAAGDGPGYFSRPKGVAADSDENIYVVDALFGNVQVFDKEGRLLMAFGKPGHGFGEFWLPSGIFIDGRDRVFVSDSYNKRVQIFQYMKGGELPK